MSAMWIAVEGADGDVADVVERERLPGGADEVLLTVALDVTSADVGVVRFERFHEVAETHVVGDEAVGARRDQVLLLGPADGVHLDDSGNGAELGLDDPILNRAQIHRRVGLPVLVERAGLGFDRIHVDLSETGGDRPHARFDARRQLALHLLKPLVDELTGEVNVGAVREDRRDL
jgi:hypothetical protein